MVQRLRFCTSNAGGSDSIPGWQTKISHAIWHSQKKKKKKKNEVDGLKGRELWKE